VTGPEHDRIFPYLIAQSEGNASLNGGGGDEGLRDDSMDQIHDLTQCTHDIGVKKKKNSNQKVTVLWG